MILTIDAGPGSGKTTTITNALYHIRGGFVPNFPTSPEQADIYEYLKSHLPPRKDGRAHSVIYLSHTNAVKDMLISRLPSKTKVLTFHGAGQSELRKARGHGVMDKYRLDRFISQITGKNIQDLPFHVKLEWLYIKKLVNYYKTENLPVTLESFKYITSKYSDLSDVRFPYDWQEKVKQLLTMSAHPDKTFDYADMVWMALRQIRRPSYDIGFIDESQDLGGATFALVKAMCHHLVFVGDKNQAINAFAGADEEMFEKVVAASDAILPLKTTFRCPLNIIEKANKLIPNSVLPGPNKRRGNEANLSYPDFIKTLSYLPPENCLVLSRTNAPLLPIGLSLIKRGLSVELADKDIGNRTVNLLKQLKPSNLNNLWTKLDDYRDKQHQKKHPMAILQADELVDAIRGMSEDCNTLDDLYKNIKIVTTPPKNASRYLLSTIHKAKGLESENVFIINPPIEHPLAMNHPIARKQELNLHFVAITRTKLNLYWVRP